VRRSTSQGKGEAGSSGEEREGSATARLSYPLRKILLYGRGEDLSGTSVATLLRRLCARDSTPSPPEGNPRSGHFSEKKEVRGRWQCRKERARQPQEKHPPTGLRHTDSIKGQLLAGIVRKDSTEGEAKKTE